MIEGLRKALCTDRVLHTIAYVGVLCLIVIGCIPENVYIPGYDPDSSIVAPDTTVVTDSVPVLEVSVPDGSVNYFSEGISFGHTADEISIAFRCAEEWTVKVIDVDNNPVDWCRVSPSLGGAGLHEMKVSIKENTDKDLRLAHIVFMAFEDVSRTAAIEVRQEGVNLFLGCTDYEVAPHDTTIVVELKANVDFEYKIVGADWVREQPAASRALTSHSVAFAIDANPSHKPREARILFYNSRYPVAADTLTIVQRGLTPTATVPDGYTDYFAEDLVLSHMKGEAEVAFHSNVDWTLQLVAASGDSTSWCSVEPLSGKAGLQKVKVRVTGNDTYAHRSLTLRLLCDTIVMDEILVLQERENAILLGRKAYTVSCEATTIDVSVSTNVDFECKMEDADWVREQQSATRGLTTHNLTFEVDANPSHKPRETRIVFYSSEYAVADTLTIAQEGVVPTASIPEGYTDYFTDGLSFGPMASEAEVTFQVNVDWQLATVGASSWLSVESSSGTAGQQTVTVRVTENNGKDDRAATISLMCDDIKLAEIVVKQEKKVLELSQTEYNVSCEATTIDVSLSTNVDFEYKIEDADWVREQQSATRGLTTHNLTFEVDANPSRELREARITFYSSEYVVADTLTIVQEGFIPPSVTTGEVTNVTFSGVTLSGTINNAGQSLTCGIIYGTSSTLSSTSGTMKSTTSSGAFSVDVTGLSANTTYYYRAYVVVNGKHKYGEVLSFKTLPPAGGAIDLGLSVKWASWNVGAESPEEYGGHYAWGETEEKKKYDWSTYKWCNGSKNSMTKYCTKSNYGTVDTKTVLAPEDDAATVNWGDDWRMPTLDEMKELFDDCTWSWTTQNGVNGYRVTGPNGNSIFLPAAGYCSGYATSANVGSYGDYWSGTLDEGSSYGAYGLHFASGYPVRLDNNNRYYGRTVRPVYGGKGQETSSVTVTTDSVFISASGTTLSGTINNAEQSLTCGIIYGTFSTLSSTSGTQKSTTSSGAFSVDVTGLSLNTTYYYRAFVIDTGIYKYGDVRSFTTESVTQGDAIDLGLSVKWASRNVGADSPEDYGGYYAWGETEEKENYHWSTYKWCNGSKNSMTKYCTNGSYGTVDNKTTLDLEDDVAHIKCGGSWRMPTLDEIKELINNCTWKWTTMNGINGCKVTGPNGNSIFLPATGEFFFGDYWSGTLYGNDSYTACCFEFSSDYHDWSDLSRCSGLSVRPVTEK